MWERAPAFVDGDGHGVGQVQAAAAFAHRQAQALAVGQGVEYVCRQATALWAEQEGVPFGKAGIMERPRALGGERKQARLAQALQATGEVGVALQGGVLVIVQARAAQALVVHLEA